MNHHRPIPELYVSADAASALLAEASKLPAWTLEGRQAGDLDLLLGGGLAPLRGYMTQADHRAAEEGADGPWPAPFALQVDADFAAQVDPGDDVALRDGKGVVAVLSVTDCWGDPALLGGKVKGLRRPGNAPAPNAVRAMFRDRGAERVLAVHPVSQDQIEAAVEHARQLQSALLIQPAPGVTVSAPADAVLAPVPIPAPTGDRAVLWQALVARNHGATHLLVPDPGDQAVFRPHQARIGLQMVG